MATTSTADDLFHNNFDLIDYPVRRLAPLAASRRIDRDDLEQHARMALWRASEGYDPGRRVPFRSWARRRIRWELLDLIEASGPQRLVDASPDDGWGLTEAHNRDRGRPVSDAHRRGVRIAGDALASAWSVLSDREKEVLWRRFYSKGETAPWDAVAFESGLALSSVMRIAREALAKLRPEVEKRINDETIWGDIPD